MEAVNSQMNYQDYSALVNYQRELQAQNHPNQQQTKPNEKEELITVPEDEFRPEIPVLPETPQEDEEELQQAQEEKDRAREILVGATYIDSKKTQFEILLEGMNSEDDVVKESSDMWDALKTLRDIQEQNNTIEAYAKYQEYMRQ